MVKVSHEILLELGELLLIACLGQDLQLHDHAHDIIILTQELQIMRGNGSLGIRRLLLQCVDRLSSRVYRS